MKDDSPSDTISQSYDVFLSHNTEDKPSVEQLARRLEEVELTAWLDKWDLIPGDDAIEALEKALGQSRACAVFLGPGGIGPWQKEERQAALRRRVRDKNFRVIPVLLPGAASPTDDDRPDFLFGLIWVDFRQGLDDEEAFRRLAAGIRGIVPERSEGDEKFYEIPRQSMRMRWAIGLAVVLLVASLALLYWRTTTASAPEPIPAMQVIVDNAQGQPAIGAVVEVDALPGQTFTTNSDGAVSISNIPLQPGDKIRIKVSNGKATADVYLPFPNPNSEHIVLR